MSRKNYVVYVGASGAVEKHRLKAWGRANPQEFPSGLDLINMKAGQMWSNLEQVGWAVFGRVG